MLHFMLEVENFTKIKHAKINVSDMTLLIGDNNSGKSYLMRSPVC
jgi:predicted ATP-dependent endonuclease of OLD family